MNYFESVINDQQRKLVKKVVNKKLFQKLSEISDYVDGMRGARLGESTRKKLTKGVPIPKNGLDNNEVKYALLELLEKLVGGKNQTAKIIPLNDFAFEYKESDKKLDSRGKYNEWTMILAKKSSKKMGFSLGDLLFRIQNKKDKIIVFPELRDFDEYEVDMIYETIGYFLTSDDMYKVAGDKYNVIRR